MYSTWRINDLKAELRKRGASLRGKKADLIERLELYDQNFNFGRPECSTDDDPILQVPPNETYRDINSNTVLPPLNATQIRHYLSYTQKKFDTATVLYESRHLLAARSSIVGDNTFIKGYCKKTMKDLQYEVDIKLDQFGNPIESHCECPAGSGTSAVCKHIAVLLLAIENMVREKVLLKFEVCTQKLQDFHAPKKQYSGTPVRAEKLLNKKRGSVIFEPYPISNINKENYNSRIRNLALNFLNSTMPIKQLYQPANPYALEKDHGYTEVDPKIHLLKNLDLLEISNEKINHIEQSTRHQSECNEWHQQRKHRLTASNFHTICHLKPTTMKKYAREVMDRCKFHSRATNHGILNEKIALTQYSAENELEIEPCGLFISKERPYLAASPDGLLGSETIIEIKCPYASRFKTINSESVPYLVQKNNIFSLKSTTPYYHQIQGQLYCTGRKYCNLIVYTYKEMKVVYVSRNEAFIANMLEKLDNFYEQYFQEALLEKYLYFNYHKMAK